MGLSNYNTGISRVRWSAYIYHCTLSSPDFSMAGVASQIILHPTISQGLKFGGTTVGRDKVSHLISVSMLSYRQ